METEERYTLNTRDVDVYALYPWRRQSKRHSPRLPALPKRQPLKEQRWRRRHMLHAGREAQ